MLSHSPIKYILFEFQISVRSPTRLPGYAYQGFWTAKKSKFVHFTVSKEQTLVFEIVILFRRQEFTLITLSINTVGRVIIETEL